MFVVERHGGHVKKRVRVVSDGRVKEIGVDTHLA